MSDLLGSESYNIRCSIIESIGNVICSLYAIESSSEELQRLVSPFLRILEERFKDNSSFVRAKVLSTLSLLIKKNFVLFSHRLHILQLSTDRLSDKSIIVRKKALQLLNDILSFHPFSIDGGGLSLTEYTAMYRQISKSLLEKSTTDKLEADGEIPSSSIDFDDPIENMPDVPTSELLEHATGSEEDASFAELILKKKYYSDGIRFIKEFQSAIEIVFQILFSSSKSEVVGAIELTSLCISYKLVDKNSTLKRLLYLIWSVESIEGSSNMAEGILNQGSIKEHLLNAFSQHLFFRDPTQSASEWANKCTWNLLSFISKGSLSISEFKSLERILWQLMSKRHMAPEIVSLLWKIFANPNEHISFRRCAILLLSCLDPSSTCHEKMPLLLSVGLDHKGCRFDPILVSQTLKFLLASYSSCNVAYNTLSSSEPLPSMVCGLILHLIFLTPTVDCGTIFELLQSATRVIFKSCSQPVNIFSVLLKKIIHICSCSIGSKKTHIIVFSKVLFLLGQVCIQYVTYLEFLEQTLTQRKSVKNDAEISEERRTSMDLQNISLEEEIREQISYLRETAFLFDKSSLLSHFIPMIAELCTSALQNGGNATSSHRELFLSGMFCLSSMMLSSSKFCQSYLKIFVQLLLSPGIDAIVRANLVVVFGDLILIHGAHLDHSLKYLFETLSDSSCVVRTNAIIVISHLIINGIIKGKGSLADLCLCLVDDNSSIVNFAKMFFSEFSAKDHSLFNALPDMISCLSSDERIDSIKFKAIMHFLLNFIDKDKHIESVIEKVCSRFQLARTPAQWSNLSFCLSQININTEKSAKKIIQALPYYYDKLPDGNVFGNFKELLAKMKKVQKPSEEFRTSLEEYEKSLVKYSCQTLPTLPLFSEDQLADLIPSN
ncbi:condensin complex subunit 1 [Mitosporidium daphniae]|uniref:Condensin complex subunit 1 n=1 Tax=Mitosporidium daphniae TaxID=1485682 RepID=A0A098VWD0_9MICR|nr:condensin complex subunit 1 [Mitosporidium daphniae]KGG53225.1 condensin complex subunit 1 [Mitosporidium daphniae]|eukprot:XP_013239661.1 condensin complex subunit 1 [Mitosporidium daphniae]